MFPWNGSNSKLPNAFLMTKFIKLSFQSGVRGMGFVVTSMPLPHFKAGAHLSHSSVYFLSNLFLSFLANGEIPGCGQEYAVSSLTSNSYHVCSATMIPLTAPYISRFPQRPCCMTSPQHFSFRSGHSFKWSHGLLHWNLGWRKEMERRKCRRVWCLLITWVSTNMSSLVKIFPDHPS